MIAWVVITLVGAGISFYNAFSDRGVSLYRVDVDQEEFDAGFCPQCGRPVGEHDQFCRHCGGTLEE
jgi:ribosomal protein S27AE